MQMLQNYAVLRQQRMDFQPQFANFENSSGHGPSTVGDHKIGPPQKMGGNRHQAVDAPTLTGSLEAQAVAARNVLSAPRIVKA